MIYFNKLYRLIYAYVVKIIPVRGVDYGGR